MTRVTRSSPRFRPNGSGEQFGPVPIDRETGAELVKHLAGGTGFEPVTSSVSTKRQHSADQHKSPTTAAYKGPRWMQQSCRFSSKEVVGAVRRDSLVGEAQGWIERPVA
jgi:hypothetical protein